MNDHHALITQLCAELDHCRRMLLDDRQVTHPLADRARAALDRPEPERLTDDKLMDIARATDLVYYMGKGGFASRYQEDTDITAEVLAFARAALAADGPAVPEGREPAAVVGEPVAEGPTDEEVEAWAGDQGFIRGHGDHPCGFWIDDGDVGALVRAAIARWGRPARSCSAHRSSLLRISRMIGEANG